MSSHRALNIAKGDVAHHDRRQHGGQGRVAGTALTLADADADRASDIVENQIGKRNVFKHRTWVALEFHWAAVHLFQYAIGNRDITGMAAPKTEHRPARAEVA